MISGTSDNPRFKVHDEIIARFIDRLNGSLRAVNLFSLRKEVPVRLETDHVKNDNVTFKEGWTINVTLFAGDVILRRKSTHLSYEEALSKRGIIEQHFSTVNYIIEESMRFNDVIDEKIRDTIIEILTECFCESILNDYEELRKKAKKEVKITK